jgi:PAS domain S-box-containing protein
MVDSKLKRTVSVPHGLIEAILGTVSDAIIATDADGLIKFWNPGAVRIFGFHSEEAVGSSLDLIIPESLKARHWAGYNRVMATGESHYDQGDLLSVPGLTKDGRRISVEFTIVLLHDKGRKPVGAAAILRDVTKRFEEARELRRRLTESRDRDAKDFGKQLTMREADCGLNEITQGVMVKHAHERIRQDAGIPDRCHNGTTFANTASFALRLGV